MVSKPDMENLYLQVKVSSKLLGGLLSLSDGESQSELQIDDQSHISCEVGTEACMWPSS